MKITLKNSVGSAVVNLNDDSLDRFRDCGFEFSIQLSDREIQSILQDYPRIAFEAMIWGGSDTEVGDEFFEAFVKTVTETSWSLIKQKQANPYEFVQNEAKKKGYSPAE